MILVVRPFSLGVLSAEPSLKSIHLEHEQMSGTGFTKGSSGKPYGDLASSDTGYGTAQYGVKAREKRLDPVESKRMGKIFFAIAGLSFLNVVLLSSHIRIMMTMGLGMTLVLSKQALVSGGELEILTGAVIVLFLVLGVFAMVGSLIALVIGFLVYCADTILLCWDGAALHPLSVVIHGLFLVGMLAGIIEAMRSRSLE